MKRSFLFLVAAATVSAACSSPRERQETPAPPVGVSMVQAQLAAIASSFEAGGVVRARSTAPIASRVMAPVLEVRVRPGDRVRRGAALVTLDSRDMAANRSHAAASVASASEAARAAESDVRSAQAAVGLARATHDRIRTLHEKRSATAQELDQTVSALDAADAQLNGARARLAAASAAKDAAQAASESAEVTTTYAVLTAPFDGLVIERAVDPGAMAVPGVALLTIEDAASFRLDVVLDEARAANVAVSQTVNVELGDSHAPGFWTGQARVSEIARVDPASHSFVVKLDLPAVPSLRSGVFGRARFDGPARQTLVVPASAAVRRGQLTFVYTVSADNRAKLQPISPGVQTGERIEVLAGLRAGERVIASPPAALTDGAPVSGGRP